MIGALKNCFSLIVIFVSCSFCAADVVYVTLPKKDAVALPSKQDVLVRVAERDVAVAEFFEVDSANRAAETLSHPAGRRQYFIVVDLLNLDANQAAQVRSLVQQFVTRVPREDLIALAAINNEDGLRFYSGLTSDRSKFAAGWNAMGKVVLSGQIEGPEGNIYPSTFSAQINPVTIIPDQEFISNLKTYAVTKDIRKQLAPLYVQAFVDLVSIFSTVPGRKHLILFSPGTDVSDLQVNLDQLSGGAADEGEKKTEQRTEEHRTLDELSEQGPLGREEMDAVLRKSTIRNNDANVVPKLMEGTGGHVHVFRPGEEENGFLKDLAQKSRGSYRKFGEFAGSIDQILNLDKAYYVIGWQTALQNDFHELQPIQIQVKGLQIDTPQRWLAPKPLSDYTAQEKKLRLSQAVYKNFGTENSYRFWSDIILDNGFNRVASFSQVTGHHLLEKKAKKLDLIFYGFALDEHGTIIDFSSTPITLDLTNQKLIERLQKSGLKIWNVLLAGQRPVTVRSVVWNTTTGDAVTHSSVVDFDVSQLFLTNPFFPSSNFDWILWPAPDQPQTKRGQEITYPYKIGVNLFAPELFPRLQAQEKGKVVYFKVYNFTPGDKYPAVRLSLIGENGNSTEIQKFGLLQQPRMIEPGGMEVFWSIESIPVLDKGSYRFQVNVTDAAQGKSVIRDVLTFLE